jgi:hypothetical protein
MGAVRCSISMTIIGAPQCRQTKTGAAAISGSGWMVNSGMTCSNSRTLGEAGATHGVGEQTVVTDAMEAAGQHMQQEAAHELAGFTRHGLVAGASRCTVFLPAEGDAAFIECDQALVGDRDAVRIA